MDWTLRPERYDNGNPCWCVTAPDGREANFDSREDAELFFDVARWPEDQLSARVVDAIWTELERQSGDNNHDPCVVRDIGLIDGGVDMTAVASAVMATIRVLR